MRQQLRELQLRKEPVALKGSGPRLKFAKILAKELHLSINTKGKPLSILSTEEYVNTCMYRIIIGKKLPLPSLFGLCTFQELQQCAKKQKITLDRITTPIDHQLKHVQTKYPNTLRAMQRSCLLLSNTERTQTFLK